MLPIKTTSRWGIIQARPRLPPYMPERHGQLDHGPPSCRPRLYSAVFRSEPRNSVEQVWMDRAPRGDLRRFYRGPARGSSRLRRQA